MRGASRRAWDAVFSATLSPPCAICGRVLDAPLAGAVCGACWASIRLLSPPLCARCGYPITSTRAAGCEPGFEAPSDPARRSPDREPLIEGSTGVLVDTGTARVASHCVGCTELRTVDRARALGPYEGVLREVLHALKYAGRRSTAGPLAQLLRQHCADVLHGADAVVPVPLHPWRAWTRGFNQAELVASGLGPPLLHALSRRRHTPPQASLSAEARAANLARAFAPSLRARLRPSLLRGARVVLVDDVSTTGATLDACAHVLKEWGAREVRALTVARTLRHA